MRIAVHGHMGRDEALFDRMPGHEKYGIGSWENPGLADKARASGGDFYIVKDIKDVQAVANAVEAINPDMFVTNFDDSLAAGVVDEVRRRLPDILIPCPDKEAAKVEWDKFDLREIIEEINPNYNPIYSFIEKTDDHVADTQRIQHAITNLKSEGLEVTVKPRNPTGGKGVKVMGRNLDSYEEAERYAAEVLASADQTGLEIQERLDIDRDGNENQEFTLQILTDGDVMVRPPTTYDYPYRYDGDTGPGTGGMGTFSMKDGLLPFVAQEDYNEAMALMKEVLIKMKERGRDYKGVLYPTFFKTPNGIKMVEINARGGDPEFINTLDLMIPGTDMAEVLKLIAQGELQPDSVKYRKLASAMLYLVSPDYAGTKGPVYEFEMRPEIIHELGVQVRFAAAERVEGNKYRTVGASRTVGLSTLAFHPWEARSQIDWAIDEGFVKPFPLEGRKDVASKSYIEKLAA